MNINWSSKEEIHSGEKCEQIMANFFSKFDENYKNNMSKTLREKHNYMHKRVPHMYAHRHRVTVQSILENSKETI